MSNAAFLNEITLDALEDDPYPIFARLRREAPVAFIPAAGMWFVTRYEECEAVGTGAQGFAGAKDHPTLQRVFGTPNILSAEGQTHKELRAGTDPRLQPRPVMEVITDIIRPLARERIRAIQAQGRAEIMTEYFEPVSVEALRHVMGLDDIVDSDTLRRWFHALSKGLGNYGMEPEGFADADAVSVEIAERIAPKYEALVRSPDESMLGHMIWTGRTPEDGPRPLDLIMPSLRVILLGGMQEPGHAAGSTLLGLFSRPEQWAELVADPEAWILPAINEGLRWLAPIGAVERQSDRDTTFCGQTIPAGEIVQVLLSSANRDETRFADPDLFDMHRKAQAHQAFGNGAHFCAGHFFARQVELVMFEELVAGLPNLRAEPGTEAKVSGWVFRAPKDFPVLWDAVQQIAEPAKPAPVCVPAVPAGETRLLRVAEMSWLAEGVMGVTFDDPSGAPLPGWTPGAHIDLWLSPDRGSQYSLCGDPADAGRWTIAVALERDGRGGSRFVHEALRPGMVLHVGGPRNTFEMGPAARYVFVAGGIGITPIHTMVAAARQAGIPHELVYCGRSRAAMAFVNDYSSGEGIALHPADGGPRADMAAIVARAARDGAAIYACGPTRMREALEAEAARAGVALHCESFEAGVAHSDEDFDFEVELTQSGRRLTVPKGETILSVLARNGVEVRQSCREGNCGSCETRLLAGAADHRDMLLTRVQKQANDRIMLCVSRAAGPGVTLTLDL